MLIETIPISVEFSLLFLITLIILIRYAAKSISPYIILINFISWFLCFVIIVLVPLDVYFSIQAPENQETPETEVLLIVWKVIYWTMYIFSWVVLPFLWSYVEVGEFSFKEKMKGAFKAFLISYGVYLGAGAILLAALIYYKMLGEMSLLDFLTTFSNCFGIFLIILCLGNGLVYIPKRYFQKTNKQINLKYYLFQLTEIEEDRAAFRIELEDLIKLIHLLSLRKDNNSEQKDLLNRVLSRVTSDEIKSANQTLNSVDNQAAIDFGELTRDKIVDLNFKLKKMILDLNRLENKYETNLKKAIQAEDVLEAKTPEDWAERHGVNLQKGCGSLCNSISYLWHTKLEQVFFLAIGIIFTVFSVIAFLMEILSFIKLPFFDMNNIISRNDTFIVSQVVCLLPLCYICLCVYSSLFRMKLGGMYGLYPSNHTDAGSLVFASVNFARVATPLVFNFLRVAQFNQKAVFTDVVGSGKFATSFTQYCPMILILLVVFNVFDLYGKLLTFFGLSRFQFSSNFNDEKIDEGRGILAKARRERPTISRDSLESDGRGSLNAKLMGKAEPVTDLEDSNIQETPIYSSKKSFR